MSTRTQALLASVVLLATSWTGMVRADAGDDSLGRERIERFDVRVFVGRTGRLDVVETIRVVARGDRILHGIHRDIDARDAGQAGFVFGTTYAIVGVTRDGHNEPYTTTSRYLGISVRIGHPDRTLAPGVHEYRIRYRTSRRIEEVGGRPLLTWSVTGAEWPFPIEHASIVVRTASRKLPTRYASMGAAGVPLLTSTSRDAARGRFRNETVAPLVPGQSLRLRVEFPRGAVAAQSLREWLNEAFRWRDFDWIALAGLLMLLAGLALARFVSDPGVAEPIASLPVDGPPSDLSAGKACGLDRFAADEHVFTAGILELVERGFAVLEARGAGFVLSMSGKTAAECRFVVEEAELARALFGDSPTVVLDETSRAKLTQASKEYRRAVEEFLVPAYFHDGREAIRLGVFWVVATFLVTALASPQPSSAVVVLITTGFVGMWVSMIDTAVRDRRMAGAKGSSVGMIVVVAVPALSLTWVMATVLSRFAALALVASFVVLAVFDGLLEVSTSLGATTRAQVETFRARLRAERGEQAGSVADPVDASPTIGRWTSYAFALGVHDTTGQFALAKRLHETLETACLPPASSSSSTSRFSDRSRGGGGGGGGGGGRSGGGGW